MTKPRTEFGKRLLNYLYSNDLSIISASRKCGIHHNTLSNYINNGTRPNADILVKLCRGLGVSADWLLGLKDYDVIVQEKQA